MSREILFEELLKVAKPILFNTDMVRAILDGRKTVTRRMVKSKQYMGLGEKAPLECLESVIHRYANMSDADVINMNYKPPYQPGDILYVRETWNKCGDGYRYKADWEKDDIADITKWRPSIHMPKEATRIWLKVTDVRVEQLQEITEEQAQAEGCNSGMLTGPCTARGQFENLWNFTHKNSDLARCGWKANPWVWVIEFEGCEKPESEG